MKKIWRNSLSINTLILLIISIISLSTIQSSNSNTMATEKISLIELVEKTSNEATEVIGTLPEEVEEVKEETQVVEEQKAKKEETTKKNTTKKKSTTKKSTTTNKTETKKEETKTEEPKQETVRYDKFGKEVGSISISNSNFKRDLVSDDTSYYYLDHTLDGKLNYRGVPFIDYRNDFNGRKTIIYSHSAKDGSAPFNFLQNYNGNEAFYKQHQYITVKYNGHTYKYQIFSVYISVANDDYDEGLEYYRVMRYTDAEWEKKIQEYKNNSDYDTGVSVSKNDKILILQTCSMDKRYYNKYYRYNQLVMAKLISVE